MNPLSFNTNLMLCARDRDFLGICYESSVMTRSHLSSKIFTASVNSTSGGNAPVDSMVTMEFDKET